MGSPLALIVCGAPLAVRTPDIAEVAVSAGWEVSVTATQAARPWLDEAKIIGRDRAASFTPSSVHQTSPSRLVQLLSW